MIEIPTKLGWKARLLGFKIVERGQYHVVVRLPIWITPELTEKVVAKVTAEFALADRTHGMNVTHAGRLVRLDMQDALRTLRTV